MKQAIVVSIIALAASALAAQEQDAEGCKDSNVLSRMRSCHIYECSKKDFDQTEVIIAVVEGVDKKQTLEGEVETITYFCPGNLSPLMVVRNAQAAMKGAGFTNVYTGKDEYSNEAVTARKGGLWVSIHAAVDGNETRYDQTVVHSKQMEQQMVANAEAMEADIARSGYCSIYGIQFDTGKAVIQPASEPTLKEVARLLSKNGSWKMQVEGHTDNVGGKEANLKLSQARADAVRAWLVAHGVNGARLVAKGFGDSQPVADNGSDEGRAKNRRVDLRKL